MLVFGDTVRYFSFDDFYKNVKVFLSIIGKMYLIMAFYKFIFSFNIFAIDPFALEEYFVLPEDGN